MQPVTKQTCDNRLFNLRWCTLKENTEHCMELGRKTPPPIYKRMGKEHCNAKAVIQYDIEMNFIKQWWCIRDIERKLGYKHTSISSCCKGKLKTSYGFIWRYGIYQ